MPNEKIEVGYRNIGSALGQDYYHKFLLYTDKNGQQYTISGWADELNSTPELPLGKLRVLTSLPNSPVKTIGAVYNEQNPDSMANQKTAWVKDASGNPLYPQKQYRELIAEGIDLSAKWAEMVKNAETKDNIYPYDFINQNSNSLADVVLREAGFPQPKKDGFTNYLAPGSFNNDKQQLDENIIPKNPGTVNKSDVISDLLSENNQQEIGTQVSINNILPKHQKFVQQCEDKLVAICNERGITADSPQDFKNIAAAIATKGIIEQGMDKVEKATIDGSNFYIGSYSPHVKIVSVNVNEAVNIPAYESMEKIQKLEQQTAQKTQERQMTQEQNQGRSMV